MTATTTDSRDFDIQVLEDTVRGEFAGKNVFMESPLVSSGAVVINAEMPRGRDAIDDQITVPYFGTIGDFVDNPENTAVTPQPLSMTNEKGTVARSSLAFEVTRWARGSGPEDPYVECTNQIKVAANRRMGDLMNTAAAGTPLVKDVYSATVPAYLDWDLITDARAIWEDEDDDIVGMIVHPRTMAGLRKLRDADGHPLLVEGGSMQNSQVPRFQGIPLVQSARATLTGSSMSAVTAAGTTPPTITLSGTPKGAWNLKIKCTLAGARGTFKIQFSTDGGNTYSGDILSAASVALLDPSADSTVGMNGDSGLTATIANAAAATDNVWTANAILKASSLILQRGAMTFWYSAANMGLETDKDILKHNDVAAMHMYHVAHRYRRRRGGTKPGVVKIVHNVPGFTS
jgi:hypothetical protein